MQAPRRPIIIQDYGPDPVWIGVMIGLGVLVLLLLILVVLLRRKQRQERAAHREALVSLAAEAEALRQSDWEARASLRSANDELVSLRMQTSQQSRQLDSLRTEHNRTTDTLTDTQREVQRQRQLLIQADKLNSLGLLVATVLHELNSPLGAIKGTVQRLVQQVPPQLQHLPQLLASQPPQVLQTFEQLLCLDTESISDTRSARDTRDQLTAQLRKHQLSAPEAAASALQRLGLTTVPDWLMPLLRHSDAERLLEAASILGKLPRSLNTIDASVGRTQRILATLRTYAQPGDAPAQPVHLAESIDTVLALHRHVLQPQVQVERQYRPLPPLVGHPDQLAQVWTNLITNAAQAIRGPMEQGRGCIWIELDTLPGEAIVRFRDDGPGISIQLQDRIFEPFISTKTAGAGQSANMGLGLYVAQQIILNHSGRIVVRSQPGHTVFEVHLPINATGTASTG